MFSLSMVTRVHGGGSQGNLASINHRLNGDMAQKLLQENTISIDYRSSILSVS